MPDFTCLNQRLRLLNRLHNKCSRHVTISFVLRMCIRNHIDPQNIKVGVLVMSFTFLKCNQTFKPNHFLHKPSHFPHNLAEKAVLTGHKIAYPVPITEKEFFQHSFWKATLLDIKKLNENKWKKKVILCGSYYSPWIHMGSQSSSQLQYVCQNLSKYFLNITRLCLIITIAPNVTGNLSYLGFFFFNQFV